MKGWRGFLGRPPRRVGSDPDGRDRKETNTEITIQAGKVNKFRLEKGGKTFTLTFDPTQHTGYREAVRAAFTLLIEAVGKSKAWKVYTESIQKLAGDNSLWSKDGKWIGEGYSYKTTL